MTTIVSWINNEREFPTLWTVADSRVSNLPSESGGITERLLDCAAKIFSIRVVCVQRSDIGQNLDGVYYSTTIGMAYAGSSLLGLNLHAFVSYTLGNLVGVANVKPSMKQISDHVITAFKTLLSNYIDSKTVSTPVEISIFGYCLLENRHQLFHINHSGKDREVSHGVFEFIDIDTIHLMGSNKDDIYKKIISDRNETHTSQGTNRKFWRSPLATIKGIIGSEIYPGIGGKVQLGICYPLGFKLTPIYQPDLMAKYFKSKAEPHLIYQGIDMYSNSSLMKVGDYSIEIDSIVIE